MPSFKTTALLGLAILAPIAITSAADVLSDETLQHSERDIEARNLLKGLLDFLGGVGDALSCGGCQTLITVLQGVALLGDDLLLGVVEVLCQVSGVVAGEQIEDICSGAAALEGPIFLNTIRSMTLFGSGKELMCSSLFKLCSPPELEWTVPLPSQEKPQGGRPTPSGKKPIQIVQYSDLHVDPDYTTGASTNCSNPILCCRPYSEADAPGNNDSPAGPFGEHKCDPPHRLQESMFKAINKVAPDALFSIFTGDIIEHDIWETTRASNELQINQSYENQSSFFDLVYPVIGNHESSGTNSFPARDVPDDLDTQWVYDTVSPQWIQWTGDASVEEVKEIGAYSTKYPNGNLRIISLNTNFYYLANFWMYSDPVEYDPEGQFAWLVDELDAAEKNGEHVYIIGHMPMGDIDSIPHSSNYFNQITQRYSSTIAAMFFGHTHVDHFEITYSDYSNQSADHALITSYICPALTPLEGMPAFRIYDVDPETYAVLDHTTYIADMDDASFQTEPEWTKYYSAKEAYSSMAGSPDMGAEEELTAAFWHKVTEAFEANPADFDAYFARKTRGWEVPKCSDECRQNEICQLRAGRAENNCVDYTPFTADDEKGPSGNHCGSSVLMPVLQSLGNKSVREKLAAALG